MHTRAIRINESKNQNKRKQSSANLVALSELPKTGDVATLDESGIIKIWQLNQEAIKHDLVLYP